jgi:hypothetical protein
MPWISAFYGVMIYMYWNERDHPVARLCLLEILQARGVAAEPPTPLPSPRELLLASFERYLLTERGLAAGTVVGYLAHAARFLDGLPAGGLAEISAAGSADRRARIPAGQRTDRKAQLHQLR